MDRDGKFCPAFRATLKDAGTKPVRLPPRSPDLDAIVGWTPILKKRTGIQGAPAVSSMGRFIGMSEKRLEQMGR